MNKSMEQVIAITAISLSLLSCSKTHKRTEKVCNQQLYVEIYERNQLGISYLTDSTNFRIYIGQLNFENEHYSYKCANDSIFIIKISTGLGKDARFDTIIDEYRYNIIELQKANKWEN